MTIENYSVLKDFLSDKEAPKIWINNPADSTQFGSSQMVAGF